LTTIVSSVDDLFSFPDEKNQQENLTIPRLGFELFEKMGRSYGP
jgi:hypothetical protein